MIPAADCAALCKSGEASNFSNQNAATLWPVRALVRVKPCSKPSPSSPFPSFHHAAFIRRKRITDLPFKARRSHALATASGWAAGTGPANCFIILEATKTPGTTARGLVLGPNTCGPLANGRRQQNEAAPFIIDCCGVSRTIHENLRARDASQTGYARPLAKGAANWEVLKSN